MSKLVKVSLDNATHPQMLAFGETAGLEIPTLGRKNTPQGRDTIREMLTAAGYESGIFVVEDPIELAGASIPQVDPTEFDPDNERWAHFMVSAPSDEGSVEAGMVAPQMAPVPVGVNGEKVYIPVARRVICREIFYIHLNIRERRHRQRFDADGRAVKGMETYYVDRFPHSFYGWVGYVNDGMPKILETDQGRDIHFISPGGTIHEAYRAQQRRWAAAPPPPVDQAA